MAGIFKVSRVLGLVMALGLAGCGSEDEVWPDQSTSTGSPRSPNAPGSSLDPGTGTSGGPNPPPALPGKDQLPIRIVPGINDGLAGVIRSDGGISDDPLAADGDVAIFNVAASLTQPELGIMAITTTTFFCSSPDPANVDTGNGSITITRDDQDPVGRSTGDSVTETFNACVQFNRTVSGTKTDTVVSMTGLPFVTAPWNMETKRATNLTIDNTTRQTKEESTATVKAASVDGVTTQRGVTGTATVSVTDADGTTTRTRTFNVETTTNLSTLTLSKSFDVTSSVPGGRSLSTKTLAPISGSFGAAPDSGIIEIREQDAATGTNRIVRITAQPQGLALVEVDDNGDGVIETSVSVTWRAVIGAGNNCITGCGTAPVTVPPGAPGFAPQPGTGPVSPVPALTPPPGFAPPVFSGRRG